MEKTKYDIFISYRRSTGSNYARNVQLKLESYGYRVFLDYDELHDGVFDKRIENAIHSSKVFLLILSKNCLDRCTDESDWIRREIETAQSARTVIVPINYNKDFSTPDVVLPDSVRNILKIQFSEIVDGQLFNISVNQMVEQRIKPYITIKSEKGNTDWEYYKKVDVIIACVFSIVFATAFTLIYCSEVPNRSVLMSLFSLIGGITSFFVGYLIRAYYTKAWRNRHIVTNYVLLIGALVISFFAVVSTALTIRWPLELNNIKFAFASYLGMFCLYLIYINKKIGYWLLWGLNWVSSYLVYYSFKSYILAGELFFLLSALLIVLFIVLHLKKGCISMWQEMK